MSEYIKVQGHANLVRDLNTHAIINKDKMHILSQREEQKKHKDKEMR